LYLQTIGKKRGIEISINEEFLRVLKHDLHKIHVPGALTHKEAMPNERAREATRELVKQIPSLPG